MTTTPLLLTDDIIAQHWAMLKDLPPEQQTRAFDWVERLTGIRVGAYVYAPSGVGLAWMRKTAKTEWMQPLRSKSAQWRKGSDLSWHRGLTDDEQALPYIHLFDVNAAYLAVLATNDVGTGEPNEIHEFRRGTRSIYRAKVMARDSHWTGEGLPSPLVSGRMLIAENWWYEPQLRFALDAGWYVDILEGYQFPETHAVLRTWAQQAWTARESVKDGPVLHAMMKAIITRGMGMLDADGMVGKVGYRPDWWGWIISENRRRRLTNIQQQMDDNGAMPFLVDVDTLAYASNEPDPAKACPVIMKRPGALGGYKHVKTIHTPRVFEGRSANEVAGYLKSRESAL